MTRNVQLPVTFRSTFCEKNAIEKLLPLPCVCQNTPSRPWFSLNRFQSIDRVVHAEELVVLGGDLGDAPLGFINRR